MVLVRGGDEHGGAKKYRTDGEATVFVFNNAEGDLVFRVFHCAKGFSEEVEEVSGTAVRKILSTVRLQVTSDGS